MATAAFRFPLRLTWHFGTILLAVASPLAYTVQLSHDHAADPALLGGLALLTIVYLIGRTVTGPKPRMLLASPIMATGFLTGIALLTDALASPVLPILVLPLVFAASMLRPRWAAWTLVAYALSIVLLVGASWRSGQADGAAVAIIVVSHLIVAVFAGVAAELLADARDAAELGAEVAAARTPDALAEAIAARFLHDDIVAATLAVVDGSPPTLATVLVDAGQEATHSGVTMRITAADSFARAAFERAVVQTPDPSSPNVGARIAAQRGYAKQVVVPLRIGSQLVAVLVLSSSSPRAFAHRRIARLERRYGALAEACSAYLRSRDEIARRAAAERAQEGSSALGAAPDADALAVALASASREVVGGSRAWVLVRDGALLRSVAHDGEGARPIVIDPSKSTSISSIAMARGETTWVPDVKVISGTLPLFAPDVEALLAAPVPGDGGARGAVVIEWAQPHILRSDERVLVGSLAGVAGVAWSQLEMRAELERRAEHDGLTDLLERRAFQARLEAAAAAAPRPLALLQVDLDHLKHLNDHAGHGVGDAALLVVADVLRAHAPGDAAIGRLGGDEFAMLVPGMSPDDALNLAQRIVAAVRGRDVEGAPLGISVSAGVAVAADRVDPRRLTERADGAARAAKALGRGIAVLDGAPRARIDAPREAVAPAAISHPTAWVEVAARVATEWLDAFAATSATVSYLDGGDLVAIAQADRGGRVLVADELDAQRFPLAGFPATADALDRGVVHVCGLGEAGADPAEAELLRELHYSALLLAPLVWEGRALGTVEVYDQRSRAFTAVEQRLALALARAAAERLAALPAPDPRG